MGWWRRCNLCSSMAAVAKRTVVGRSWVRRFDITRGRREAMRVGSAAPARPKHQPSYPLCTPGDIDAAPTCPRSAQDGKPGSGPGLGAPKAGSYVPPSLRNRGPGDGESMQKKREDNSIRVTNLSEDVTEGDLQVGGGAAACGAGRERIPCMINQDEMVLTGEGRGRSSVDARRGWGGVIALHEGRGRGSRVLGREAVLWHEGHRSHAERVRGAMRTGAGKG